MPSHVVFLFDEREKQLDQDYRQLTWVVENLQIHAAYTPKQAQELLEKVDAPKEGALFIHTTFLSGAGAVGTHDLKHFLSSHASVPVIAFGTSKPDADVEGITYKYFMATQGPSIDIRETAALIKQVVSGKIPGFKNNHTTNPGARTQYAAGKGLMGTVQRLQCSFYAMWLLVSGLGQIAPLVPIVLVMLLLCGVFQALIATACTLPVVNLAVPRAFCSGDPFWCPFVRAYVPTSICPPLALPDFTAATKVAVAYTESMVEQVSQNKLPTPARLLDYKLTMQGMATSVSLCKNLADRELLAAKLTDAVDLTEQVTEDIIELHWLAKSTVENLMITTTTMSTKLYGDGTRAPGAVGTIDRTFDQYLSHCLDGITQTQQQALRLHSNLKGLDKKLATIRDITIRMPEEVEEDAALAKLLNVLRWKEGEKAKTIAILKDITGIVYRAQADVGILSSKLSEFKLTMNGLSKTVAPVQFTEHLPLKAQHELIMRGLENLRIGNNYLQKASFNGEGGSKSLPGGRM